MSPSTSSSTSTPRSRKPTVPKATVPKATVPKATVPKATSPPTNPTSTSFPSSASSDSDIDPEDSTPTHLTILDILRPLLLLPILLPLLSYLVTSPPSYTFNYAFPPAYLRPARVRAWWAGPLHLTDAQLALYNGSKPDLPILLGLQGEIYDVSASPHIYGPGGSYAFFAGRDGARAFVTGCWDVEKGEVSGDLRGLEWMFVAEELDPESEGEKVPGGEGAGDKGDKRGLSKEEKRERKLRRERELRLARKKVNETIEGWRKLFDGGKDGKYFWRGTIQRGEGSGWEGWGEVKELCDKARKGRARRTADQV